MGVKLNGGFVVLTKDDRRCIRCKKTALIGIADLHKGHVVGVYCRSCYEKDRIAEGWARPPKRRAAKF
jgi:late competence protein required for DNA uptake (superfamily II DNA/RNA helicase)